MCVLDKRSTKAQCIPDPDLMSQRKLGATRETDVANQFYKCSI